MENQNIIINKAWRECIDNIFDSTEKISKLINSWKNDLETNEFKKGHILSEISSIRFDLQDFEGIIKRYLKSE